MSRAKHKPSKPKQKVDQSPSGGNRFLSFIASPVVRRLVLLIVAVVLLYLFVPRLLAWGVAAWEGMLWLFGVGLGILVVALAVLVWVIWQGHFSASVKRWNWLVGGVVLALALWGIFSFFSPGKGILSQATLGGVVGQSILGVPNIIGGLRIAGLVLLGVIFILPHKSWQVLRKAFGNIRRLSITIPRRVPKATPVPGISPSPSPPKVEPSELIPAETSPSLAKAEIKPSVVPEEERRAGKREPILTPGGWQIPPIDILDQAIEVELNKDDIEKRARLIEEALLSYGVEAKVAQINMGPTVTQFGVEPGWDRKYKEIREKGRDGSVQTRLEEISRTRVRVERITSLANDLALALAAPSIRIEAPVPGKSLIGIEVPNIVFGSVALRSVIETAAFQKLRARTKLAISLGKGAGGEAVVADLDRMPHLLIAGATGSGKTVCLGSVICCLLLHNSPDDVQFIMVDPKRVELVVFNGIPHLVAPVIVDSGKAMKALRWLNQEMDNRYRLFSQAGARNIEGYNKDRMPREQLPYLVLVIDELADLMMTAFDEVEHTLCRLAQLARATGIHLVVATQRPSVDVVTGLIKSNFPTRISFAVTSQIDSRTILDTVGAEKLLGRGDMLYMPTEASKPKRLQGAFISDTEMDRLVYFWGNQGGSPTSIDFDELTDLVSLGSRAASALDPLLDEARRLAREHKHVSTSFLQRRLHIGYPRAARLMETLEQEGLVEARPREGS